MATIAGEKEVFAQLDALESKLRKQSLRKAVNAGSSIVLKAVKRRAPVEVGGGSLGRARAGLLKKSLGRKVKAYKSGVVVGIVGARKGFRKAIGVRTRG